MSNLNAGSEQHDFIKIKDTVAPLGTCDISFSLGSNSHGNFHKKSLLIEYRFIENRFFIETTDPF